MSCSCHPSNYLPIDRLVQQNKIRSQHQRQWNLRKRSFSVIELESKNARTNGLRELLDSHQGTNLLPEYRRRALLKAINLIVRRKPVVIVYLWSRCSSQAKEFVCVCSLPVSLTERARRQQESRRNRLQGDLLHD